MTRLNLTRLDLTRLDLTRLDLNQVAQRTTRVYDGLVERARPTLLQRLQKVSGGLGIAAAPVAVLVIALQYLLLCLLCAWRPADEIERAPDFPTAAWASRRTKYEPLPVSTDFLQSLAKKSTFVPNGSAL